MMIIQRFCILLIFLISTVQVNAQDLTTTQKGLVRVDNQGVLRWSNGDEVLGFGVNYTVPFAHAYRAASELGINHEEAIDQDVYHFARLGFDLYRVHVWDTEISDSVGNLLANEHLRLFDYLLSKLSARGINYILTPIAFWGNGWPEPDYPTPGFSNKFGKGPCLVEEKCIQAQENYLFQFLNHVNQYTGIAFKDDPNLIAFEVSNEPHHREEAAEVTEFINRMVVLMRKTGSEKPIFYNVSHSVHFAEDYFKADIQGGTFQWYPTGLGYQRELQGNFLPNVDRYHIPFDQTIRDNQGAKMVYEFDAADVGKSYIYPAMARSFRTAGIQVATHFSYDPTFLAYANTEYNTHYMNLAYTPKKALGLMIASEVFHSVPMYRDFGKYPDNTAFGNFRVSYEEDLAEMITDTEWIYSNHTATIHPKTGMLEKVAGYGSSKVVTYHGLGAYFLDRLEKGVWRLEIMPDALWVDNPFGRNSLNREVAVINWQEHPIKINIPDLGENFEIKGINLGNDLNLSADQGSFPVLPGTYLLINNKKTKVKPGDQWNNITINEYDAPSATIKKSYLLHDQIGETAAGIELEIMAQYISPDMSVQITAMGFGPKGRFSIPMKETAPYHYVALIPRDHLVNGFLYYNIIVSGNGGDRTYPHGKPGKPGDWDFDWDQEDMYRIRVVDEDAPIYLFDAQSDAGKVMRKWVPGLQTVPGDRPGTAFYQVNPEQLFNRDSENLNAVPLHDYSIKHAVKDQIRGRRNHLATKSTIVVHGHALNQKPCTIQVALTMKHGQSYGGLLELNTEFEEYRLAITDLKPVKTVILPRPYPTFLPYYFESKEVDFDINQIESIQISLGPGIPEGELSDRHGYAIQSIRLE